MDALIIAKRCVRRRSAKPITNKIAEIIEIYGLYTTIKLKDKENNKIKLLTCTPAFSI